MPLATPASSSFRDPSGFMFQEGGQWFRQVNERYRPDFEALVGSGLYDELVAAGRLIPHAEVAPREGAWKVLKPHQIDTISYPYEWCFSQLKDAALATLAIQVAAIERGMSLKDASAYNIQFLDGRAVHIDTLSFERLEEGRPWVAYGQFCQHFLAPLALMARTDIRLSQLSRVHIDGVPLDLAAALLPWSTRFSFGLGLHVHAHASSKTRHAGNSAALSAPAAKSAVFSKTAFLGTLDSLRSTVESLDWRPAGTEWADYYERNNNYGEEGLREKEQAVGAMLDHLAPKTVWDLGANTGRMSRLAASRGAKVVAWDIDPACVEANWRAVVRGKETNVLPLLQDLTNPSGGIGWGGSERMSIAERGPVDVVMALGLIHHLAISNNVPMDRVAAFLAGLGRVIILEFVPKEDSQVRKLLSTREDIFPTYDRPGFEAACARHFTVEEAVEIPGTCRTLYRLRAR